MTWRLKDELEIHDYHLLSCFDWFNWLQSLLNLLTREHLDWSMWTIVVGTRLRRFHSPKVRQRYVPKNYSSEEWQQLPRIISRAIIITKYVLVVWNILNLGLIEEFQFLLVGLKWLHIYKTWVRSMWHDCTPTGNMGNDMKNILSIRFAHFTVSKTHWWYNESLSLHFNKKKKILREVRVDTVDLFTCYWNQG